MSDEWEKVRSIFERVVDLRAPEREARLRENCGDDAELRAEVCELLCRDEGRDSLLDRDAWALLKGSLPRKPDPLSTPPEHIEPSRPVGPVAWIDHYQLLKELGQGGMGEVWLAEQREPVRRRVALKVVRRGMDSERMIARFETERQALATMSHPSIARVFDAGTTPRGRPYFVMEYMCGLPITDHCDRQRLTTRERLELLLRVCDGVQHAHYKGIIHRDLKPSNVLVELHGDKALPKIIDFGIARMADERLGHRALRTEPGVVIGTPEYMSPEQADLSGQEVDTRTDVYALGVLLYELLTGTLPFDSRELRLTSFEEIRRWIREVDPPTPSNRLRTLDAKRSSEGAWARSSEPALLLRQLRGDLDRVTMRALEKDRTRRYESPSELAADIRRHLADEPVLAGPACPRYRAWKFVRRNRAAVGFTAILGLLLVGFAITMAVQAHRIARERDRAHMLAAELEQLAEFQAQQFSEIDPELMGAQLQEELLDERRAALIRADGDAGSAEEPISDLTRALAGVNFTNVASRTLDASVFRSTRSTIDSEFAEQPLVRARLLHSLAVALCGLGLLDRADAPQTEALRLRRDLLGDRHPDTLTSIDAMAQLRADQGRYAEAERLDREAISGRRERLGPDDPDTLRSLVNGHALLEEAWERSERALGAADPHTIEASTHLGFSVVSRGELAEAE